MADLAGDTTAACSGLIFAYGIAVMWDMTLLLAAGVSFTYPLCFEDQAFAAAFGWLGPTEFAMLGFYVGAACMAAGAALFYWGGDARR